MKKLMRPLWLAPWTGNVVLKTRRMGWSVAQRWVVCIEATVLAAVGPGSNPASDGVLLHVSLLSVSFYLSCPLKGIKKTKKKEPGWMDGSVDKNMVG